MKVTRMPQDTGPPGWNRLLPVPDPAEELAGNIAADWLVIGAGFAGLAAARRLSQLCPTDRIVILDATRVAEGPAGRNSGFMIDLPHDLSSTDYGGALDADIAQAKANRHGIGFAAEMAKEYGLSAEAFSLSGKVNAAATAKGHAHNISYSGHLALMNEPHEMLDAQQMRDMTGSSYYQSGLYTPGTAMIQPAMFVRGVAQGLKSNRPSIYENSPVISLKRNPDWIAATPKGQVTAKKVILAVNGHLNSFGFAKKRLMHVILYASMTRVLSDDEVAALGGNPIWGVTPADPMGSSVRRISGVGGNRILIRNKATYDPSMTVSQQRVLGMARAHDRTFAARFPKLAGIEMEYRWSGRLCLSRNNVAVVGELDEGLYSACCQNGLGTAKGTHHGVMAAELATGLTSELLTQVLAADPPQKLPPAPFDYIGANAYLKWLEVKAGAEL